MPSADFEVTGACRSEANQVYAAVDDVLPSGRWAYQGVSDSNVVVGLMTAEEHHDADCDGTFDWASGLWVMNSYEYDPADGVCSYKAYVSASSTNEMNVPYDDFEYICPSADEKKTASPTMMLILIAAAVGIVVVIAAGSACVCTRKRPSKDRKRHSKGTRTAMHKQDAVEMT